jgi:hypothetical protein
VNGAEAISSQSLVTYASMAAGDETPEAKLQKLHLARQKGTEM